MQGTGVEPRQLSASSTKFVRWVPGVVGAIATLVLAAQGQMLALPTALLFAIVTWVNLRFCVVTLEGQKLRLSNFKGEVIVPLTAITSMEERKWTKPRGAIILHFDRDFGIGEKAEFMPRYIKWNPFGEGELLTELKQLVKDAQWEKSMKSANLPFELPRPE